MKAKKLALHFSGALIGMGVFAVGFQNCSQAKFTMSSKDATLSSSNVFPQGGNDGSFTVGTGTNTGGNDGNIGTGNNGSNDGNIIGSNNGGNDGNTSGSTNGGNDGNTSTPAGTSSSLPLETYCSQAQSYSNASDLAQATSLTMTVKDDSGNVVCTVTNGVRDTILNKRILDFSSCSQMTGNSYNVTVVDPNKTPVWSYADPTTSPGNLLYYPDNVDDHAAIQLTRAGSSDAWTVVDSLPTPIVNSKYALILSSGQCQTSGDPLIIDTAQNAQNNVPVDLSNPLDGILFDILGVNSWPQAHTPMKISWWKNHNYMFLTLPNSSGNVTGIDQMFGNNNIGPDGKFASNGFLALAKYDLNHDGKIDKNDPIFSQLRLWSDVNNDGVSEPGELYSLDQMGIVEIDLQYDTRYKETDAYGNQVKYKSVVTYSDGSLHLIFDLWFTLKANPAPTP